LISKKELPFTLHTTDDDYVYILPTKQNANNISHEHSSANAECMSIDEMKELVWNKK
jgi:hypothetical protein